MSICFITANYGREQLLDVYCMGIERLRSQTSEKIYSVCVGEENDVCKKYDMIHEYQPNQVSGKFQRALEIARDLSPDYVIIMGSDNVVNFEILNYSLNSGADFVNPKDVYFMDVKTGKMFYLMTSMIGVARFVRKDLLTKLDWKLWRMARQRGLDTLVYREVSSKWTNPLFYSAHEIGGKIIDFKSDESMNPINRWVNMNYIDPAPVLSFLSEAEHSVLTKLII